MNSMVTIVHSHAFCLDVNRVDLDYFLWQPHKNWHCKVMTIYIKSLIVVIFLYIHILKYHMSHLNYIYFCLSVIPQSWMGRGIKRILFEPSSIVQNPSCSQPWCYITLHPGPSPLWHNSGIIWDGMGWDGSERCGDTGTMTHGKRPSPLFSRPPDKQPRLKSYFPEHCLNKCRHRDKSRLSRLCCDIF